MAKTGSLKKDSTDHRSSTAIDKFVGGKIRALRNLKEMTQDELGKTLGVSFQQIQKYEKGVNRVSVGRIMKIADALDCTLHELVEGAPTSGKVSKPAGLNALLQDAMGAKLVKAYLAIKAPEHRAAVVDLAKLLAANEKNS